MGLEPELFNFVKVGDREVVRPFAAEPARARATDPETSHAAAASLDATPVEAAMLRSLLGGPASIEEIARRTGIDQITVSPRVKPLRTKGLVRADGKIKNPSGRQAFQWALTPAGRAVVA